MQVHLCKKRLTPVLYRWWRPHLQLSSKRVRKGDTPSCRLGTQRQRSHQGMLQSIRLQHFQFLTAAHLSLFLLWQHWGQLITLEVLI